MEIVDCQIHLWQSDTAPAHHWRSPFLIPTALAAMDQAGVNRAINCPAVWDARANEYAAEAAAVHPDRFATMPWFVIDDSADETTLDKALAAPGVVGVRFILATPDLAGKFKRGALDWLWDATQERGRAVALGILPAQLAGVDRVARAFPQLKLMIDHLAVSPLAKLPEATDHLGELLALSTHPNVAVKASAVPSMATDTYPFSSTHQVLHQVYDSFGPERMFWGSDITRLRCSWKEAVGFMQVLPWLRGRDLELVMGAAVCQWVGWRRDADA